MKTPGREDPVNLNKARRRANSLERLMKGGSVRSSERSARSTGGGGGDGNTDKHAQTQRWVGSNTLREAQKPSRSGTSGGAAQPERMGPLQRSTSSKIRTTEPSSRDRPTRTGSSSYARVGSNGAGKDVEKSSRPSRSDARDMTDKPSRVRSSKTPADSGSGHRQTSGHHRHPVEDKSMPERSASGGRVGGKDDQKVSKTMLMALSSHKP